MPKVFGGFSVLSGGMNASIAASLIPPNQYAFARDFTVRDGFIKTRPPWFNRPFTFINDTVQSRFNGRFQGSIFYTSPNGRSGHVVSLGGKLFFVDLNNDNQVSEITPKFIIVTTEDFTVPIVGDMVTVDVNSENAFSVGENVIIDSGSYTVTALFLQQLVLTYNGGAANATAVTGNYVLDSGSNPISEYQPNPDTFSMTYMFLAEIYVIIMGGQHNTIVYDGSSARECSVSNSELPPGAFGVYFNGRIWITRPNRQSFIAGDIVYGPSGTAQNNFIDSILKVTENDFLNEGGEFTIPTNAGLITSMIPLNQLDTSLGVGPLLIGTTNSVVSVNAPADRTTWKNLTYPIQSFSLLDYGPQGPRSTVSVNGDMWYRSIDGVRSFIVARRDINMWGQTPVSQEVSPIIDLDDQQYLIYGSAVLIDNRLYYTVAPENTEQGIVHRGLVCINFDSLATMTNKQPPAWEGLRTGLNIFQVLKGIFNSVETGFAFADNNGTLELWEFAPKGFYDIFDDSGVISRVQIQPILETRSDSMGDPTKLKKLHTCEIFLDEIVDDVTITIKYRPDQYPNWTEWETVKICAKKSLCYPIPPTPPDAILDDPNANPILDDENNFILQS